MKIIGRKTEIRELERCEGSDKSELVCVYGRRRVGKTFLVEQTFAGSFAFRATGVEGGNTKTQLKAFGQRLKEHGDEVRTIPKDWFEVFSRLDKVLAREDTNLSPHNKKIVFLDEFPWFVTPRSDFVAAFGEFWNRCGTEHQNYMFIICGSATSWIIQNVLDNTGSLYNRVTSQIFLSPFTLKEAELFFSDREYGWAKSQILECQMIFGGLPYFMDILDRNESLRQNVDRLLFRQNALLSGEFSRLLEATLKKSPVYHRILEYLSHFRYGALKSECKEKLDIPDGSFSRAVDDLTKCGYVSEYKKNNVKGNPKVLQLADPFLLFHYSFLNAGARVDSYGELTEENGAYTNWRGHAFELICMREIDRIKSIIGISGVRTKCYPWVSLKRNGGAQIDLVIERDDKITDICEMKCTDRPFTISKEYEDKLLNKKEVFIKETNTKNAVKIIMVSATGIKGIAHTEHISQVISMDDLFD